MSDERPIPADPAGTQPKVDTSSLLPARLEEPDPAREPEELVFAPEPLEEPDTPAVAASAGEAPHAEKFQFLLGALLAIGIVALAAVGVIAADRATQSDGPAWSAWRPAGDGIAGAQEIADHVAPLYKGSNGKQLTAVTAHDFQVELEASKVPMRVAMRRSKAQGGAINLVDGDTVLYRLCGLADRCSLGGTPTESRALLLRREALEMALYTFKYLDDIDQVVLFMPPAYAAVKDVATKKTVKVRLDNQALRFSRKELGALLQLPLARTLPGVPPKIRDAKRSPDAALVATVSDAGLFTYSMVPANGEERVFLVLEKLSNQEAIVRQQERALDLRKQAAEAVGGEPIEPAGAE